MCVALINRVKQSPEIFPYWLGIIGVGMGEGFFQRVLRQEGAVFSESDEQHPIQNCLCV